MEDATRFAAGGLIAEARTLAGLTQRDLASRAGTSASAIANYEAGKRQPRFDTVVRLIAAAGFELRCKIEVPDEQDRLYRSWERTLPKETVEDWYARQASRLRRRA